MSDSQRPPETVTFTIDGRETTVPKGTLVIRAAEQLGIMIPRFCDHPLLDPVGACRQCIVEVEGQRKPMMACTTPVQDGMEVRTHLTSDVAKKGQEGTLEFLLINHPLDCPMCDKGGECPLQDQALEHGSNVSRFVDEKRRYQKPVAVSELVLLDRERCVLCARCTRFSDQISGDPFIELFERGALEQIAIYEDEPYHSYFSGNIIQICPVGALTSSDYRFRARPFDVRSASSVCDHCSAGCNFTIQSRRGQIQRQLARTNMAVNESWSCDRGRFGFPYIHSDVRLRQPKVRDGNELRDAGWAEALRRCVDAFGEAQEKGSGRVAVLTGGRIADEDAYAVSKYARTVLRTDHVDFRTRFAPPDELDALTALTGRGTATYRDVEDAATIVVVGLDPEEEVPILYLRIRKAWRNHKAQIVTVGPRAGSLAGMAYRQLSTPVGGETGVLAALGRALGLAELAETASAAGVGHEQVDALTAELRAAEGPVVFLVGERAANGALAAAGRVADRIGGKVAWVPRRAGARGALEAGLAAGALPGGRRTDDEDDVRSVTDLWGEIPTERGKDLQAILEAAAAGQIDVLHLIGVDLARDCASPELARRALDKATVICQDLAENDTTGFADVVLPAVATQERRGSYTNWEGRTQTFVSSIEAPDLCQEDWEIVVQLSAMLGQDLGFGDLEGIRSEIEKLGARTATQDWPLPQAGSPEDDSEGLELLTFPLLLDRSTMLTGSDHLLATAPEPFVSVSRSEAERLGISDGDEVEVTAGDATLRSRVRIEDGLADGVVFVPAGSHETSGWSLSDGGSPSIAPVGEEDA